MTEYWVSQKKHYCKYCNMWVYDNKTSMANHEKSDKHKMSVQRSVTEAKKKSRDEEIKQRELDKEYAEIERAALHAHLASGGSKAPAKKPTHLPHPTVAAISGTLEQQVRYYNEQKAKIKQQQPQQQQQYQQQYQQQAYDPYSYPQPPAAAAAAYAYPNVNAVVPPAVVPPVVAEEEEDGEAKKVVPGWSKYTATQKLNNSQRQSHISHLKAFSLKEPSKFSAWQPKPEKTVEVDLDKEFKEYLKQSHSKARDERKMAKKRIKKEGNEEEEDEEHGDDEEEDEYIPPPPLRNSAVKLENGEQNLDDDDDQVPPPPPPPRDNEEDKDKDDADDDDAIPPPPPSSSNKADWKFNKSNDERFNRPLSKDDSGDNPLTRQWETVRIITVTDEDRKRWKREEEEGDYGHANAEQQVFGTRDSSDDDDDGDKEYLEIGKPMQASDVHRDDDDDDSETERKKAVVVEFKKRSIKPRANKRSKNF